MLKNNIRKLALLALSLMVALSIFAPSTPVQADEDSGWGLFFDLDGNLLPSVYQQGQVTIPADWMPGLPDWTGITFEPTYNVMVAPDGTTILAPTTTTLFFMAMNPVASGLVASDGSIGSGLAALPMIAGQTASGSGLEYLTQLFQTITGSSYIDASLFADAAINDNGNIWSMFNPLNPATDVGNIFRLLLDMSQNDSSVYLIALLYESCLNSPSGCPAELCAANPAACGLPTPEPTGGVEPTPTPPPTCPGPSISQASPAVSISSSAPSYPVVVGQDPDKRGVDIQGSVSIPPVIYTWFEPVYEDVQECRASGPGASNCTRNNGQPGWLRTVPVLVDCIMHQEALPEQINSITGQAELSAASRAWIVNNLGAQWYGAQVKMGSISLNRFGQASMGCAGGTCSGSLVAQGVPFADPGNFDLTLTIGTNGTYFNGVMITPPRVISGRGTVGVYVVLPTLIDANP